MTRTERSSAQDDEIALIGELNFESVCGKEGNLN